jgi:hypothetical protein
VLPSLHVLAVAWCIDFCSTGADTFSVTIGSHLRCVVHPWLLFAGAAWLNCTPSVGAAPAAYDISSSSNSATAGSGVVPGPGTGVAGVLDALGSWDWMFNAANNGSSSSSSDNSTSSSAATAPTAEPPAVAAAGRGP